MKNIVDELKKEQKINLLLFVVLNLLFIFIVKTNFVYMIALNIALITNIFIKHNNKFARIALYTISFILFVLSIVAF